MKGKILSISIAVVILIAIIVFGRVFMIRTIEERYTVAPEANQVGAVIFASQIGLNQSILGINETRITRQIEAQYADRSIKVTDIQRVFPNKVIVYVQERTPICAIAKVNSAEIALADIDFQLNKIVASAAVDYTKLIEVEGIKVDLSFNNAQFTLLRNILFAFTEKNIPDYALPQLISKITIEEKDITINFRDGTAIKVANDKDTKDNIKNSIK